MTPQEISAERIALKTLLHVTERRRLISAALAGSLRFFMML